MLADAWHRQASLAQARVKTRASLFAMQQFARMANSILSMACHPVSLAGVRRFSNADTVQKKAILEPMGRSGAFGCLLHLFRLPLMVRCLWA
ncbi:hypothetical protein HOE425_331044 [Hoeflea sp. EC-HK425]|nr:hypothetical protein HOE425_331044 [Hoeflea sp. EC-HK425]